MIPGGFRKEIVPAGFSAEAQSKVVMTEKTEFSATVCTAVVQLDHGIPVWSLVRRGDSRRAAIDFAYLSYKWGYGALPRDFGRINFSQPRIHDQQPLVRIEVSSRLIRFPNLWLFGRGFVFPICVFLAADLRLLIFHLLIIRTRSLALVSSLCFAKTPLLLRAIADAAVQLVALC